MFFRNRKALPEVAAGAEFRRDHGNDLVERARVLAVAEDPYGIPHVRFQMSYLRADRVEQQSVRVLALASFAERYRARGVAA